MVRNMLAEGSVGKYHGWMYKLVRNPFKVPHMREQYDAAIKTYDNMGKSFIYPSGIRCIGSSWATNFWRGFDGMERNWDRVSKQSAAYAMWRAGKDIRKAIDDIQDMVKRYGK